MPVTSGEELNHDIYVRVLDPSVPEKGDSVERRTLCGFDRKGMSDRTKCARFDSWSWQERAF